MNNIAKYSILTIATVVCLSWPMKGNTEESKIIPVMSDARIFAKFTDEFPAVINYYTHHSESEILSFYQKKYSKEYKTQRKRGRLTALFSLEKTTLRVVISKQNRMTQVDVIETAN